jgi:hypothetical protein
MLYQLKKLCIRHVVLYHAFREGYEVSLVAFLVFRGKPIAALRLETGLLPLQPSVSAPFRRAAFNPAGDVLRSSS